MWGSFGGIACGGAANCTAVGTDGTKSIVATLLGGSWSTSTLTLPVGYDGGELNDVACPSGGPCRGVGEVQSAVAEVPAVAGP
jgi:hypothetical protein